LTIPWPKRAGRTYDVTVVEFFDYNCPYCRRMEPVLNALLRSDPKVRVVYRDWPIFDLPRVRRHARPSRANGRAGMPPFTRPCMTSPARLDSAGVKAAAAKAKVDWPRLQRDLKNRGAEIDALLTRTDSIARRSVSTERRR
jgi:protein-disulfide isomerase